VTTTLPPEPGRRIVVVDDSWLILEQVRLCLSSSGYEVRTTTGPDMAERLVKNADLAIIDFHMPGLNGKDLVGRLRSTLPRESSCLFYLYTSDRDEAGHHAAYGFDGAFLRKGDEAALVPQVEAVFRTVALRRVAERLRRGRGP
jgi:response regulator NasT